MILGVFSSEGIVMQSSSFETNQGVNAGAYVHVTGSMVEPRKQGNSGNHHFIL